MNIRIKITKIIPYISGMYQMNCIDSSEKNELIKLAETVIKTNDITPLRDRLSIFAYMGNSLAKSAISELEQ